MMQAPMPKDNVAILALKNHSRRNWWVRLCFIFSSLLFFPLLIFNLQDYVVAILLVCLNSIQCKNYSYNWHLHFFFCLGCLGWGVLVSRTCCWGERVCGGVLFGGV